jgi:uncharacterized protein (TIRG00374 family)
MREPGPPAQATKDKLDLSGGLPLSPPASPQNRLKQGVQTFLKVGFVAGLLYFLWKKGFISPAALQRAFGEWQLVIPAALIIVLNNCLGAVRWQWLLRAQKIRLSHWAVFQLHIIGLFFNVALPGAVSGDFVKAYYIGKVAPGVRGRAMGSILFDRVAGLSALMILAAVSLGIGYSDFEKTSLIAGIGTFLLMVSLGFAAFYLYLFLVSEKNDPVLAFLQRLQGKVKIAESLSRIYLGLRFYHNSKLTVLKSLLLTLLIHTLTGVACLQFSAALGEPGLSLLGVCVVIPLGLLITAIPIAPGGIGTGNLAFAYLFKLIGSERGADIYSLLAIFNIGFNLLGGLVYLRFKAHAHAVEPEYTPVAQNTHP